MTSLWQVGRVVVGDNTCPLCFIAHPRSSSGLAVIIGETLKSEIDYASRMAHMSRELAQQSHFVKVRLLFALLFTVVSVH